MARTTRGSMAAAATRQVPTEPQPERAPALRVKPYKATFDLDVAVLRQVKVWAAWHGLAGVAPIVRALIEELADPIMSAHVAKSLTTEPQNGRGPVKKTAYDLDPPVYRDLKAWAAEHDTTGVAVLRVLLAALVEDHDGPLAVRVANRARR